MSTGVEQALESGGGATSLIESEQATLVGSTLDGAYRITRLMAKGGMSTVYEAVQLRLHQRVAVKVMARELAVNPEALLRFRREAEITSRLRHPHLVTVTDFGTASAGQPYLVMEYLDGIDLDRRIRTRGRLPLPSVVNITSQVASALAAAHEQGIVHRDLKPANVFLLELPGEPDFAKILDFGISKVRAASTQLTKASAVIGTPNYMAPEQATGMLDEIDHRTDQWALACIAWEMLSGRTPFASDDMSAVFYQVIHLEPQPLGKRAPELPAAVEAVLRRALSKTMADRFSSIREFANALAAAASGETTAATAAAGPGAPSGDRARPEGSAWVERRQAQRERRRAPAPVEGMASAVTPVPDDVLTAALGSSVGRRRRRLYAVAAVAVGLVLGVLVSVRWNALAKASGRATPGTAAAAAPSPPLSPVTALAAAPTPTPASPSAPTRAALPQPSVVDDATARPLLRAPKRRASASPARVHDLPDPFAQPRRRDARLPAKPAPSFDEAFDSFAPARPGVKPHPRAARRGDAEFVDPFGR